MSVLHEVTPFATVEDAIEDIRQGRFVVVVDAPDRENEGDLVIAAQFATPEAINFMATHGRGLICLCLTPERCEELGLRPATTRNESPYRTAFMDSIEAREGVRLRVEAPPEVLRYCVPKGSIAVQGVSLTIAALDEQGVEIALVPHTLAATTLAALRPGDEVNLEVDVLAKYVERLVAG